MSAPATVSIPSARMAARPAATTAARSPMSPGESVNGTPRKSRPVRRITTTPPNPAERVAASVRPMRKVGQEIGDV